VFIILFRPCGQADNQASRQQSYFSLKYTRRQDYLYSNSEGKQRVRRRESSQQQDRLNSVLQTSGDNDGLGTDQQAGQRSQDTSPLRLGNITVLLLHSNLLSSQTQRLIIVCSLNRTVMINRKLSISYHSINYSIVTKEIYPFIFCNS
jgi:hypothetical protein